MVQRRKPKCNNRDGVVLSTEPAGIKQGKNLTRMPMWYISEPTRFIQLIETFEMIEIF